MWLCFMYVLWSSSSCKPVCEEVFTGSGENEKSKDKMKFLLKLLYLDKILSLFLEYASPTPMFLI